MVHFLFSTVAGVLGSATIAPLHATCPRFALAPLVRLADLTAPTSRSRGWTRHAVAADAMAHLVHRALPAAGVAAAGLPGSALTASALALDHDDPRHRRRGRVRAAAPPLARLRVSSTVSRPPASHRVSRAGNLPIHRNGRGVKAGASRRPARRLRSWLPRGIQRGRACNYLALRWSGAGPPVQGVLPDPSRPESGTAAAIT